MLHASRRLALRRWMRCQRRRWSHKTSWWDLLRRHDPFHSRTCTSLKQPERNAVHDPSGMQKLADHEQAYAWYT